MATKLETVKQQLSLRHYHMNDSWLNDCVEYFLTEHENANTNEIFEFVITQWQLSDLREISNEKGCLPQNLKMEKCTILNGNFLLQIDKGYDISTSKYKQLESIRNVTNENNYVTESEEKKEYFEPKSKRCIYLYLTDGIQEILGIEYKPIKSLKDNVLPGCKLLVKGPVTCRRGVVLLDENTIECYDGEVSTLLVPNARENIFARALNLAENPNPYPDDMDTDDNDKLFDDDMDFDPEMINQLENNSKGINNTPLKTIKKSELNKNNLPLMVNNNKTMEQLNKRDSNTFNDLPVCFEHSKSQTSDLLNDSDDEWIGKIDENQLITESNKAKVETMSSNQQPQQQHHEDIDFPDFDYDDFTIENLEKKSTDSHQLNSNWNNKSSIAVTNKPHFSHQTINTKNDFNIEKIENKTNSHQLNFNQNDNMNRNFTKVTSNSIFCHQTINTKKVPNDIQMNTTPIKSVTNFNRNTPSTSTATATNAASKSSEKNSSIKATPPTNIRQNHKITDFMTKIDSKTGEPELRKICDFIGDFKYQIPSTEPMEKVVRAKINHLDHLQKDNNRFTLDAKIFDETGSLPVTFSTEILNHFIGYTFEEFSKLRKLCKKFPKENVELEKKLRMALIDAQKVLVSLVGLYKLKINANETKPIVMSIRTLNEDENKLINESLKMKKRGN